MKYYYSKICFLLFLFTVNISTSQTIISSIAELKNLITQDNVNVKMEAGTYRINTSHVDSGLINSEILFNFTGSNSTYDFTNVTFAFDTNLFRSFGNISVVEIRIAGENNVIKNLVMEDIGNTIPYRTALGIMLDGINNRIEGVHMTVRGSFPYGYGDIFGKGTGYVLKHWKHSAILIRGEKNHLKSCTIIHRAYGHGIFCQGAIDALIEGCYLEGEVRTTDDVLAEQGTGSAADGVDFMAVWGYKLRPGWTFSLQEDGIRAYNKGAHHITGEDTNTKNMRVIDCTIKNFRSGVTIGLSDGEKYVENCTAIGTESGFWLGSGGEIVNSRGDAVYGPLYGIQYQKDSNMKIDLTVIDNENIVRGTHALLHLAGNGHKVYLKSEENNPKSDYKILVGGAREGMRFEEAEGETNYLYSASNITVSNTTGYPILIDESSDTAIIQSCDIVTDKGTNSTISLFDNCEDINPNDLCPKTAELMEAECYDSMLGIKTENSSEGGLNVGWIDAGEWLKFSNIDLSGVTSVIARTSTKYSGGFIEVRLDAVDGTLIGTIPVSNTAGWQSWVDSKINIENFSGNVHNVYFVFKGTITGSLFNVNWFRFLKEPLSINTELLIDNINVYPNPVEKNLIISLKNTSSDNIGLKLYNLNGQKIIDTKYQHTNEIKLDVSKLNKGIYFLRINDSKNIDMKKIIKL